VDLLWSSGVNAGTEEDATGAIDSGEVGLILLCRGAKVKTKIESTVLDQRADQPPANS
jgi:hypothetical protein